MTLASNIVCKMCLHHCKSNKKKTLETSMEWQLANALNTMAKVRNFEYKNETRKKPFWFRMQETMT